MPASPADVGPKHVAQIDYFVQIGDSLSLAMTSDQIGRLPPTPGSVDDRFGFSAAIAGAAGSQMAISGAWADDDNGLDSGSVYLFDMVSLADCNWNGIADRCDILDGTDQDAIGNDIPDECQCPWDLDENGTVGASDLLALLANWGPCP